MVASAGNHDTVEPRAWRAAGRHLVPSAGDDARDGFGVSCRCLADGGVWLVTLTGEHDLTSIPLLDQYTRNIWPHCRVAVIDLSGVTFLDTSMTAWLLRVETTLDEGEGSTFSIVEGPADGAAARLFTRLRMSHVLACYPTVRAALINAAAGSDAVAWPPLPSSKPPPGRIDGFPHTDVSSSAA